MNFCSLCQEFNYPTNYPPILEVVLYIRQKLAILTTVASLSIGWLALRTIAADFILYLIVPGLVP